MKKIKTFIAALVLLSVLALAYSFVEPYFIEVKEVSVVSPDIPVSFDGKRIVFVSDIHNGPFFSVDRVTDLVNRINALNPDIVILGGDYISGDPSYLSPCLSRLENISAPMGKYGVIGNQDYWKGGRITPEDLANAGITPLENTALWIYSGSDRIRLGGVADLWHGKPNALPTISGVNDSDYVILVSHNPDYAEKLGNSKVDLVLSGHTHGGQVTFFGLWAPYLPSAYGQKYRAGFVQNGNTLIYVTRGIGMTFLPIRFFARPEITVITLKSA